MSPSTSGQGRPPGRGPRQQHGAPNGNAGRHEARQPVRRPLPAEVYRRRRIVLAVGTVAVVALFVLGISLLVGGLKHQKNVTADPNGAPTPAAQESTDAAPGPDKDQASGMCDAKSVTVSAATDQKSYDAGDKVEMTMTVTNKSEESCNISAGPKAQEFIVKQDDKVAWSSKYCQSSSETDTDVQFAAGSSKPSKLNWDMVPADKNCKPTADFLSDGTYQLITKLGDKSSDPVDFTVKGGKKD